MKNLELELQLKENRRYIGEDDKGNKVYVFPSEYDGNLILKVENCPSGWYIETLMDRQWGDPIKIQPNSKFRIGYDMGSNWYGDITLYEETRFYKALMGV